MDTKLPVKAEREKRAALDGGFTLEKRQKFLLEYAASGNITAAARVAEVTRPTVYAWIEGDDEFRAAFEDAKQQAIDALEGEARRRAMGWQDTVVTEDGRELTVSKHSDTLLIFLLKGAKPAVYRERYEMAGDPNAPMRVSAEVMFMLPAIEEPKQ